MNQRISLSKICFLDVEASGLHDSCFPIEVGFVRATNLYDWSALIRPTENWIENGHWDKEAEALHGLTMEQLHHEGQDVLNVTAALNVELADKIVFSDAAEFDSH